MQVSFKPQEPKVLTSNYAPGVDNLTSEDFLKIYYENPALSRPFPNPRPF